MNVEERCSLVALEGLLSRPLKKDETSEDVVFDAGIVGERMAVYLGAGAYFDSVFASDPEGCCEELGSYWKRRVRSTVQSLVTQAVLDGLLPSVPSLDWPDRVRRFGFRVLEAFGFEMLTEPRPDFEMHTTQRSHGYYFWVPYRDDEGEDGPVPETFMKWFDGFYNVDRELHRDTQVTVIDGVEFSEKEMAAGVLSRKDLEALTG